MSGDVSAVCAHCHLPLRSRPVERAVQGEGHAFCCYGCVLAFQVARGARDETEAVWLLIRLGVGAFLAMNIMLFSLLLYSGSLTAEPRVQALIHFALLGLATGVVVLLGTPFARQAIASIRDGRLTADALIVIGAGAAYGYSAWSTFAGGGHVYFDTATMVLVLFTLGRYLEAAGRARAMRSLEPLLAPDRIQACVVNPDGERLTPVREVSPGMRVRIRPGERIPVDGRVIDGESSVEESLLTGEAAKVAKARGAHVIAGTINGHGPLLVEVHAAGQGTRWAHICRAVQTGLASEGPLRRLVDRVGAHFVYGVLVLGSVVFAYWLSRGPLDQALLTALAVLVVACPCALGLAAPLATSLGTRLALSRDCLVRNGAALERMGAVRVIALDKTGTVTKGSVRLTQCHPFGDVTRAQLLARAAALERGSEHPLGRGFVETATAEAITSALEVQDVTTMPGRGISGRVAGEQTAMGTGEYLASQGYRVSDDALLQARRLEAAGETTAFIAWAGEVRGLAAFADVIRPDALDAITALRYAGVRVVLVSGDAAGAVRSVAQAVGVDEYHARCGPRDKMQVLETLRAAYGPVAMVGDGVNDGPVLATADVGIAVGSATDLARESADMVLAPGGLHRLPWLFRLARLTRRTILTNIAWAFGYNAIALSLAAAGYLQPIIAAALMAGSSLVVVVNSLRIDRRDTSAVHTADEPHAA